MMLSVLRADPTFSYASQENGISRLYNGVHFSK